MIIGYRCPVRGCQLRTPPSMPVCGLHWAQVPATLRLDVVRTWRRGAGAGQSDHVAACVAAIDSVNDQAGTRPA